MSGAGPVFLKEQRETPLAWRPRLPAFMKGVVPQGETLFNVRDVLKGTKLPTVCEQALCPNRTECWARGTLAFQILGSTCTRRCGFCAEATGRPGPVDGEEPGHLVEAARRLNLRHVVITSPARDDLSDQGATQFAACVRALRLGIPSLTIEVLVPDFQGRPDLLDLVFREGPDIFNHNMETVRRLTPRVRARATYDCSLSVLSRSARSGLHTKSGLMVGLGETEAELNETFQDLAQAGVRSLTMGQYLPPSFDHLPVVRFYTPEEFLVLNAQAKKYFERVMAGPRVRSSYHADEMVRS
jgi:lipoic acid synthetase